MEKLISQLSFEIVVYLGFILSGVNNMNEYVEVRIILLYGWKSV